MTSQILRLILLALLLVPTAAFATADGPDSWRVVNLERNDTLNLREKPATAAKIVTKIPFDAKGIGNLGVYANVSGAIIEDEGDQPKGTPFWIKVKYKKVEGWVALRFLAEETDSPPVDKRSVNSAASKRCPKSTVRCELAASRAKKRFSS
jgi:uncharacterized protein YgiM (DUF1202 family)